MTRRVKNITGPGETDHLGYCATDLGAMVDTPRGIYMLKGDSFSGCRVGEGKWMSPIADYWALPDNDMSRPLTNIGVVGTGNGQVEQLHEYPHNNPVFSTVLPTDVIRLPNGTMVQHYMVVAGLGTTKWTEFWQSTDSGQTWQNTGLKLDANLFGGHFVMITMDFNPEDGYVYILGSGWRDRGCIMVRCRPDDLLYPQQWEKWTSGGGWHWDKNGNPDEIMWGRGFKFGEMCLRFIQGNVVLSYFNVDEYCISIRVIANPEDNWFESTHTKAVRGTAWPLDDGHNDDQMAQLYGGYIIPGSRLDEVGKFGLLVSQWNTSSGWPYRIVQFQTQVLSKETPHEIPPPVAEKPPEPEEIVVYLKKGEIIEVRGV